MTGSSALMKGLGCTLPLLEQLCAFIYTWIPGTTGNIGVGAAAPTFLRVIYTLEWEELIKDFWLPTWKCLLRGCRRFLKWQETLLHQPGEISTKQLKLKKITCLVVFWDPRDTWFLLCGVHCDSLLESGESAKTAVNWGTWSTCSVYNLSPLPLK